MDKRRVNRRVIEALVRAGALDGIEANRARLLASVGRALEAAEQAERMASQSSLFGDGEHARGDRQALIEAQAWDRKQQLLEEKTALGFSLSGHLYSVHERDLAGFPRRPLATLEPGEHRVWIAGIVAEARMQMTRRGRVMIVTLDDGAAQLEISVFAELLEKHRDKIKDDALLLVHGKVQRDEFSGGLRVAADDLLDLAAMRKRFAAKLRLEINGQADARRLMETLAPYRSVEEGACEVLVHYENAAASCDVVLGETWKVRPDDRLISELSAWLAPEHVQVQYGNGAAAV